jgi:hypothetical protein
LRRGGDNARLGPLSKRMLGAKRTESYLGGPQWPSPSFSVLKFLQNCAPHGLIGGDCGGGASAGF